MPELICKTCGGEGSHKKDCPLRTGEFERAAYPIERDIIDTEIATAADAKRAKRIVALAKTEAERLAREEQEIKKILGEIVTDKTAHWTNVLKQLSKQIEDVEREQEPSRELLLNLIRWRQNIIHCLADGKIDEEDEILLVELEGIGAQKLSDDQTRLLATQKKRAKTEKLIRELGPDVSKLETAEVNLAAVEAEETKRAGKRDEILEQDLESIVPLYEITRTEVAKRREERIFEIDELKTNFEELEKVGRDIIRNETAPEASPDAKAIKEARRRELRLRRDKLLAAVRKSLKKRPAPLDIMKKARSLIDSGTATFSKNELRSFRILDLEDALGRGDTERVKQNIASLVESHPKKIIELREDEARNLLRAYLAGADKLPRLEEIKELYAALSKFKKKKWFKESRTLSARVALISGKFDAPKELESERGLIAAYVSSLVGSPKQDEVLGELQMWGIGRDRTKERPGRQEAYLYELQKMFSDEEIVAIHTFGLAEYGRDDRLSGNSLRGRLRPLLRFTADKKRTKLFEPILATLQGCIEEHILRDDGVTVAKILLVNNILDGRLQIPKWAAKSPDYGPKTEKMMAVVARIFDFEKQMRELMITDPLEVLKKLYDYYRGEWGLRDIPPFYAGELLTSDPAVDFFDLTLEALRAAFGFINHYCDKIITILESAIDSKKIFQGFCDESLNKFLYAFLINETRRGYGGRAFIESALKLMTDPNLRRKFIRIFRKRYIKNINISGNPHYDGKKQYKLSWEQDLKKYL